MPQDPNLSRHPNYFTARANEERRLAMASKDPYVRAVHLEMAERYMQIAEQGGPEVPDVIGDQQRA